MKNVTVTLNEEVAKWIRVRAAMHDTSVSRMLGDFLTERMRSESGYAAAMDEFLSRKPRRLRRKTGPYPTRDSLHDR